MARTDMREWAKARRERTRHLIELGGLIQKAGLVELVDDDRATLGAFLEIADHLRHGKEGDERTPQQLAAVWRRRGLRACDADKEVAVVAAGMASAKADDSGRPDAGSSPTTTTRSP
jgi:hypothetical protein